MSLDIASLGTAFMSVSVRPACIVRAEISGLGMMEPWVASVGMNASLLAYSFGLRACSESPLAILVEGDITINIQETAEPVSPDTALRVLAEQLGLEVGGGSEGF